MTRTIDSKLNLQPAELVGAEAMSAGDATDGPLANRRVAVEDLDFDAEGHLIGVELVSGSQYLRTATFDMFRRAGSGGELELSPESPISDLSQGS